MTAAAATAPACLEGESQWYGSTAFLLFSHHTCNPLPEAAAVWPTAATAALAAGPAAAATTAATATKPAATAVTAAATASAQVGGAPGTPTAIVSAGPGALRADYSGAAAAGRAGLVASSSAGGPAAGAAENEKPGQCELGKASAARWRVSAASAFIDRQPWEELPPAPAEIQAAAAAAAKLWNRGSGSSSNNISGSSSRGESDVATEEELREETYAETAKIVFEKFFSDSQEERLIAACSMGYLATALACNQRELLVFLLTHLEQEDDRLVLEAVGRELLRLLQQGRPAAAEQKEEEGQQQQQQQRERELPSGGSCSSSDSRSSSRTRSRDSAGCCETSSSSNTGDNSSGDNCGSSRGVSEESAAGGDSRSRGDSGGGEKDSEAVLAFKVLLHLLLQQDRETREVAQAAMYTLLSSRNYVSLAVLLNQLVPRVLLLLQDEGLRSQAAAAVLLPIAAFHLQQRLCEVKQGAPEEQQQQVQQQEEKQAQQQQRLHASAGEKQLEMLVHAYAALCRDTALIYVQQQAGTRLPLFVQMCGAALGHSLDAATAAEGRCMRGGAQASDRSNSSRKREEAAASAARLNNSSSSNSQVAATAKERSSRVTGEKERQQLLLILAQLLSSYVNSPSETLRMQGVQGLAAMADENPKLFRELGKEFLPRLCTDVSWRVRAAVCERLERLAAVFTGSSLVTAAAAGGGDGRGAAALQRGSDSSSNLLPGLLLGEGTCLASLLTQLLKDREMNVKSAALRKIRQLTEAAGSCAGVCSAFLEEGDALCNSLGAAAAAAGAPAPIFTEFMETLCCMMRLPSSSNETRWQLTIFAFTLLNVNDWHIAVCFLKELDAFLSCPPPCFYAVLMARLEALVHSPGSCWRTRATILQQIPLLLLQRDIEEGVVMRLWVLLLRLLQDDVWAVRQEGGAALERLAACQELPHETRCSADAAISSTRGGAAAAAEASAAAMRRREVLLQQQLLPLFRDLQRSKRCVVRGEICRYVALLHGYFSREAWEQHLRPFVETALADTTPQTRYAAAKAIKLLAAAQQLQQQQQESAAGTASQQVVSAAWLSAMKEQVLADQDPDVAAVFDVPDSC